MEGDARHVVEESKRLSRSLLWQLQRRFFEQHGIDAWRQGIVPHYVTSNPFIADAYARVLFGFLRDWQAGSPTPLDPSRPVYLIELGAGSGRFAFHFLQSFLRAYRRSALSRQRVTYVLTDFAARTLAFWQTHPSLQPLVAQGLLDFAHFDAEHPQDLKLLHAGVTLTPEQVKNPLVVIANYVFDSIPQDCFSILNGELYEQLVSLTTFEPDAGPTTPDLLHHLTLEYEQRLATIEYYDDEDFNRILHTYRQHLNGTTLLFPVSALRCLRYFRDISGDRLLLLSGDKGYSHDDELLGRGRPELVLHGSFSFPVNYHAIAAYVRDQGGQVCATAHRQASIHVAAYLLGSPPAGYTETTQAFEEAVATGGPDDFFSLKQAMESHYNALSLKQILAYLRISRWDSQILLGCYAVVREQVKSAPASLRRDLYDVIQLVWDTYYPLGDEPDLPFKLGLLLYDMAYYAKALEYFQHALMLHGRDAGTLYNIGLCHYGLRRPRAALACFELL